MDAAYDHHPDVRRVGFEGSVVFETLVRISKLYGLGGLLSPKYLDPDYLADVRRWDRDAAEKGIAACMRVGLLIDHGDGSAEIPGWERYQNPDALRKAKWKERHAGDDEQEERTGTDGNGKERTGTETDATGTDKAFDGTGRDGTGRDVTENRTAISPAPKIPPPEEPPKTPPPEEKEPSLSQATLGRMATAGLGAEPFIALYNHHREARAKALGLKATCLAKSLPISKTGNRTFVGLVLDRLDDGLTFDDLRAASTEMCSRDFYVQNRHLGWELLLRDYEHTTGFLPDKPRKRHKEYTTGDEIR